MHFNINSGVSLAGTSGTSGVSTDGTRTRNHPADNGLSYHWTTGPYYFCGRDGSRTRSELRDRQAS